VVKFPIYHNVYTEEAALAPDPFFIWLRKAPDRKQMSVIYGCGFSIRRRLFIPYDTLSDFHRVSLNCRRAPPERRNTSFRTRISCSFVYDESSRGRDRYGFARVHREHAQTERTVKQIV
jgi:hypothetical protein